MNTQEIVGRLTDSDLKWIWNVIGPEAYDILLRKMPERVERMKTNLEKNRALLARLRAKARTA